MTNTVQNTVFVIKNVSLPNGLPVLSDYVWKCVVCLASVWGFFILQMSLEYANGKSGHVRIKLKYIPELKKRITKDHERTSELILMGERLIL